MLFSDGLVANDNNKKDEALIYLAGAAAFFTIAMHIIYLAVKADLGIS